MVDQEYESRREGRNRMGLTRSKGKKQKKKTGDPHPEVLEKGLYSSSLAPCQIQKKKSRPLGVKK